MEIARYSYQRAVVMVLILVENEALCIHTSESVSGLGECQDRDRRVGVFTLCTLGLAHLIMAGSNWIYMLKVFEDFHSS